ncbi:MAG: hypothetical protein ABEJ03_02415 [Candidatus Nanohaloarchaea archaeon]
MTGAHRKGTVEEARRVLGQFEWIEMNGAVAERTSKKMADLYSRGKPIEFQTLP